MSKRTSVPLRLMTLYNNRCVLNHSDEVPCAPHVIHLKLRGLLGGKGGFGANLKSSGKKRGGGGKINMSACRDLSGRRLRHVENEAALKKWYEDQRNGTSSSEDTGKKVRRMYKSALCKDWLRAREGRDAPQGASLHWGCPRGRSCVFAHGVSDMGSEEARMAHQKKQAEKRRAEKDNKMRAYTSSAALTNFSADDAVTQGLMLSRKRRRVSDDDDDDEEEDTEKKTDGVLRGDGNFSTVRLGEFELKRGLWYYEVTLFTEGLMQIGWAQTGFTSNSESGDGVGDDKQSWSYDGFRSCVWHDGKEMTYGSNWRIGDIVGCKLQIEGRVASIEFTLNGVSQGVAFLELDISTLGVFPVMSMNGDQAVRVNVGRVPFAYEDKTFRGVHLACASDSKVIDPVCIVVPEKKKKKKEKKVVLEAIDLMKIESFQDLVKSFDADRLKSELSRRGLKCGGTPEDRANRLWSVRGLSDVEALRVAGVQNKKKKKRRRRNK